MIKLKAYVSIALITLLSGCSSMSAIEKASESESHFKNAVYEGRDFYISDKVIEGERYRIFHQASSGFSGTSGIRRSATERANEFCKNKSANKKMLTVSEHTASPPYVLGNFPRIEIIFVCVDSEKYESSVKTVNDKYDQLSKIKSLRDNGVLTEEEFNLEKKKILSK